MHYKRRRFLIALTISALVWMILLIRVIGVYQWTIGQHGYLIPVYPHPFEIMLLTIATMAISTWLFVWSRRDRVQQVLSGLDAEEKDRLLRHLLVEDESAPRAKRKRAAETAVPDDLEVIDDLGEDAHPRRMAR